MQNFWSASHILFVYALFFFSAQFGGGIRIFADVNNKRNWRIKKAFLNGRGFKRVPKGYQIDHIIPLSAGGLDTVDNMQLLPIYAHMQKTYRERMERILFKMSVIGQNHDKIEL